MAKASDVMHVVMFADGRRIIVAKATF